MEFQEKFIDKNIAELCKTYDMIKGANTNIARITPDYIDGLKPVQRRALYIMYLKDQGKSYRKLATISGDTFGRVHPHSPVSIEDAIVGIEQPWHNSIPLVDGEGNWGCHDGRTMVLTKNGWVLWEYVTMDDELYTRCPETHEELYERPTNLTAEMYCGKMVYVSNEYYDFMVTPNHKMIMCTMSGGIVIIPAEELLTFDGGYGPDIIGPLGASSRALLKRSDVQLIDYEGMIYCAEVPTYHTLVTKRNEKILFSGNSVAGDVAGASRYIKARLSKYSQACFFEDWKDSVVDMEPGYDEETMMPLYLPAKYPNVLLNGCLGIGYGLAANLPCFNFKDVAEATITLMLDPNAPIVLIPDSPTGADVIETNFARICDSGNGNFLMRCTYEIDAENNVIRITSLPYQITADTIRKKIAEIKESNGLPELVGMSDLSGKAIDIQLQVRDDVNPYKFMKKLIAEVPGLEKSYPVNITVVNDWETRDYSIKQLLLQWIDWRREQKRIVVSHRRTTLLAEKRVNDIKIFILSGDNLEKTQHISKTSRNQEELEANLLKEYRNTEIHLDSMQAHTIAMMRNIDFTEEAREGYVKKRDEIEKELKSLEDTLNAPNGIDTLIIAELRDGVKRFGSPRRSNVVPAKIKTSSDAVGACIIQLASDGTVNRKMASNVYEEPIPADNNGFAVRVDNDASFILIDDNGYHSYVRVKDIPFDSDVPVNRYSRQRISGNIVAMLPCDIETNLHCVLISAKGVMKRINISEMGPSKKPCISIDKDDHLVRGIVLYPKTQHDILVYTRNGMGQRLDPNSIRVTSPNAKGSNGFKLTSGDEIVGCYAINPAENQYILYVTAKGKMRLNNIEYLPLRDSKHDAMLRLISLNDRDKLVSIVGCNKLDKVKVFFDDATSEIIDLSFMEESTMGADPKKVTTTQNAVTTNIVKTKLL